MAQVHLRPHETHPKWNYTILSGQQVPGPN